MIGFALLEKSASLGLARSLSVSLSSNLSPEFVKDHPRRERFL